RDSDILYITSREGKVYASNHGTETTLSDWVELENFNFYAPTHIFENPQDPKLIYVTTTCGGTWSLKIPFEDPTPTPSDTSEETLTIEPSPTPEETRNRNANINSKSTVNNKSNIKHNNSNTIKSNTNFNNR
ncbi:MAG: hypothetical protein LBR55_00695, partial [Bacteroidales bacterium]|nr:hypothetical protein [Bacteroidales bacterium]